jgi:hypothetical protein
MTYVTHTRQAIVDYSVDKKAAAQAELDKYIESQAEAVAPTQDPLTARDRRIIGEIIEVEPESVRTIWIEGGITVWVRFVNGSCLPFDRDWFAKRVAEVKATLNNSQVAIRNSQLNVPNYKLQVEIEELAPQTSQLNNTHNCELRIANCELPRERNERLSDELEEACVKFNLWHLQIDWLSFSTKLYRNNQLVGYIGCNYQGWYSRPRTYGMNRFASSASEAITFLGVRPAVAA